MKAMILKSANELVSENMPSPILESGEVMINVTHSGMCGTDLKIYQGHIPAKYPLVMGHESIGEVAEGSIDFPNHSRVIVDPVLNCGTCFFCNEGSSNLCLNGGLIGRDCHGGFAEYQKVPAKNIFQLPDEIPSIEAPLIQPLTTCLHAQEKANIVPGEAVLVMGLGVTGLLHIQLAKAHGAYPVIGVTRSKWKQKLALDIGADLTFSPDETTKDRIMEVTNNRGVDVVIESVGKLSVFAQAIDFARPGGRILLFGIYTEKEASLPFYDLYYKELLIINARAAQSKDYPKCIDFVKRGSVKLGPLISHTLPLENLGDGLDLLTSDSPGRMKIILDHHIS